MQNLRDAIARLPEMRDDARERSGSDYFIPDARICLGPGRCEALGRDGGCEWCLTYPSHEGADYAETFLRIHAIGN